MRPYVIHWLSRFMPSGVASALAPSWFTCVGIAGVAVLFAMIAIGRRHGIERRVIASIVLWCYLAAVSAGIAEPMVLDAVQQLGETGRWMPRWAGMTSYWGYLGGVIAIIAVCRRHRVSPALVLDIAAAPIGLAVCIARMGCFLAGCDYGKVTSVPWAVRFPAGSPAWLDHLQSGLLPPERVESLPVHPTQLYESALGLVMIAVALLAARTRWARPGRGRAFLAIAATYAIGRLAIEVVRGDAERGVYGGLSSGQIFSIAVLVGIAAVLVASWRRAAVAVAAGAAVVCFAHAAHAQPATAQQPAAPAPAQPQPQPAAPPAPAGQPAPLPPEYGPQPAPPPVAYVRPAPPPGAHRMSTPMNAIQVGALFGFASPINRRSDQVSTLIGESVSVGYEHRQLGAWLDFDNYENTDAIHRTLLASGSGMQRFGRFRIGGRFGLGATFVSFKDPVFRGAVGSDVRFEALAEYRISRSWTAWARPITIDIVTASDLGGPIATYQMRIGIAYRFDLGPRAP